MIKKITFTVVSIFLTFLFCLFLLELTLKTGLFDNKDHPSPIWIPEKFKKIDRAINKRNYDLANLNPHGFTDIPRELKKTLGMRRIAVLGDSFIWGYGLPYEQIWSHKLETLVVDKYKDLEVMSWGHSNWSTLDELSFLEKHGVNYDIDMLIVGFVENDPDMGEVIIKNFPWSKNIIVKILGNLFTDSTSFLVSYINRFLTEHFYKDHQIDNWENALFSDDNLKKYQELLHDFSVFCNSNNIELLFVLTPSNYENIITERYDKIIPLLEQANIKYLNLLLEFKKEFGHINIRKLWANPANGHPGDQITSFYAREVFNYLNLKGNLSPNDVPYVQEITEFSSGTRKNPEDLVNTILKSNDWDIKKKAAVALGEIEDSQTTDMLINALNDSNSSVRESAVLALGEINEPRTIGPLIRVLKDDNAHIRMRAVLEIGKRRDPRIMEPLITLAIEDDNQYVRRRALLALMMIRDTRVVETLIQALRDKSYFVRKTAVIALGKMKDTRAIDPMNALLKNDMRYIRIEIAEALGEFDDPRAVEALKVAALKDKDPYIRDLAAASVKKITGQEYAKYRRKLIRAWQRYF